MVMKKHILFIVENAPVPHDGRVWSEALTAKEYGYKVSIISPKHKLAIEGYTRKDGIDIYRHFAPFEADGKYAFLIEYGNAIFWELLLGIRIFLRKPFHIIHSANPPDHVFLIAILFKIFGVKYIFDHHDISPENYIAKFHRKDFFYKILTLMEKLTFRVSDIVISTNESYKKIAIERGEKKSKDVFVVRNGPQLSEISFPQPNSELKEGLAYLVTYVGVIGNQEGIDNLLRIIDYIVNKKHVQNIKFVIIGTGPHWQKMVDLSKSMNLEKWVRFTGYIPYADFYELLATSDICVNPEPSNEFTDKSTMLKIMDYMTFGKPIIQFKTIEGQVTAGDSAIYIENNDEKLFAEAIIDLINNPSKRNAMGAFGWRRIKDSLNWEKQKDNLFRAYSRLESL
jgi:glycosyltransferase involved in cell wall biosynthesis